MREALPGLDAVAAAALRLAEDAAAFERACAGVPPVVGAVVRACAGWRVEVEAHPTVGGSLAPYAEVRVDLLDAPELWWALRVARVRIAKCAPAYIVERVSVGLPIDDVDAGLASADAAARESEDHVHPVVRGVAAAHGYAEVHPWDLGRRVTGPRGPVTLGAALFGRGGPG